MKISGQNILEVNEGKSPLEMHRDREKLWLEMISILLNHCNCSSIDPDFHQ